LPADAAAIELSPADAYAVRTAAVIYAEAAAVGCRAAAAFAGLLMPPLLTIID